jgi:hypothetical protein
VHHGRMGAPSDSTSLGPVAVTGATPRRRRLFGVAPCSANRVDRGWENAAHWHSPASLN